MSIFANRPFVLPNGTSVNVCFQNGDKIVSIALDDSCGRMQRLARGTIDLQRVQGAPSHNVVSCTEEVFPSSDTVPATMANFNKALAWMNKMSWGFDAQEGYKGAIACK